jgi:GTP cyclohydrolase I
VLDSEHLIETISLVAEGVHECMTLRGVHKPGVSMVTMQMLGVFQTDPVKRQEILNLIGSKA